MNFKHIFICVLWLLSLVLVGRLTWEYTSSQSSPEKHGEYVTRPFLTGRAGDAAPRRKASSYDVSRPRVESFVFDPNEADTSQLLRLGLTPAQVRSICRHRARGYVYSSKEDFSRVPFLTKGQWAHLAPLIRIGEQYQLLLPRESRAEAAVYSDTLLRTQSVKEERPSGRDTSSVIPRVNLNRDSFKRLVGHPFLSFVQVKALKAFQRRYGAVHNMSELLALSEFSAADTARLSPYVDF